SSTASTTTTVRLPFRNGVSALGCRQWKGNRTVVVVVAVELGIAPLEALRGLGQPDDRVLPIRALHAVLVTRDGESRDGGDDGHHHHQFHETESPHLVV